MKSSSANSALLFASISFKICPHVVTPSARIGGINIQFRVAARNLHKVKLANQLGANVYDILKHEKLVLTLPALRALEERLG